MFSSYIIFYFSERFINGSLQGFPWGGEKIIVLCCLFFFKGKIEAYEIILSLQIYLFIITNYNYKHKLKAQC